MLLKWSGVNVLIIKQGEWIQGQYLSNTYSAGALIIPTIKQTATDNAHQTNKPNK